MRASNYNFFFPYEADNDKVIAYNSYANALALMDKSKFNMLQDFTDNGVPIEDEEFVAQLKAGCFLVDDNINELDRLKLRMLRSRFRTNYLGLTIAPTADCNFRCTYCYEKDVIKPDYMTLEVEEATIQFVKGHMKTISILDVGWYGGEPLMNFETVKRLSEKLIAMCEEHGVDYNANMVTNGYLITKDIAQRFAKLKITSIQVTVDGNEEIHNKMRPLADGTGTFSTIINNLVECKEWLPPVSLRINIDKNNTDASADVTRIISEKGLQGTVTPYLGKITDDNDCYDKSSCFDSCGFSREEFNYFSNFAGNDMYMRHYPRSTSTFCGADSLNAYVIASDGRLYKCWHDMGNQDKCVGHLVKGEEASEGAYMQYMLFDPTTTNKCAECNMLPVCMGGCPYYRNDGDGDVCTTHKFVLNDFMKVIAAKLKLQKDVAIGHECHCQAK